MKQLSDITVCFVDHGLFIPLARHFATKAKRVLYWSPYERGFSKLSDAIIGDGFECIERCLDFWKVKKDVDLFVFPDVEHSGMQLELESQGFPVWGARSADSIELNRIKFLGILKDLGLDVPPHTIVKGVSALREHLRDKTDKYVKISHWRGDMETFHWRDWGVDKGEIDILAVRFGPAGDRIPFIVFDNIDTEIEIGGDGYCVNGAWPDHMLHGIEWKDKSYLGAVTPFNDMPQQIRHVLEAFSPILQRERYRSEWSSEIRVKDDKAYFIDPTCRGGMPSTSSQMMLWHNFPEIIWAGANGELVQPVFTDEYSVECVLCVKEDKANWSSIEIPESIEEHCKLSSCCRIDGRICFPPSDSGGNEVGWLVATGKSPKAAIENIKELAKQLPDGLTANVESLVDILKEIEVIEDTGIDVGAKPMPAPEVVLDSTV